MGAVDETNDYNRVETTVFELAGHDKAGLLAEVTDLLCANDCNVRSAAVSSAVLLSRSSCSALPMPHLSPGQLVVALLTCVEGRASLPAQVWTHEGRVAFVLSVTERGRPVSERKLDAFHGRLMGIMDAEGEGIVRTRTVGGLSVLHHLRESARCRGWAAAVMQLRCRPGGRCTTIAGCTS